MVEFRPASTENALFLREMLAIDRYVRDWGTRHGDEGVVALGRWSPRRPGVAALLLRDIA